MARTTGLLRAAIRMFVPRRMRLVRPAMTDRVMKEVQRLQTEGPSADLVAKAREGARRDYETALKQNAYWLRRLQTVHLLGQSPGDIITRAQRIDAVTPAAVQEVFKKYFPLDRYTIVTLVPE